MVCTRGVPAHAESSDDLSFFVVECEPAAEDDDSANRLSHKRIIGLPEFLRISGECGIRIWTAHYAVEGIAGLSSGINIAGRESKIIGAESICRVCFLSRYETAARPFRSSIRTGKHDCANYTVAIYHRAPFLVAEASIRSLTLFDGVCQS